jgi:hypothetical protein
MDGTRNPEDGSKDTDSKAGSMAEQVALRTPEKAESSAIRASPPILHFLSMKNAKELKIGEVQDLLTDYQRLAKVLGTLIQRADEEEADTDVAESEAEGSTVESGE